MMEFDLKSYIDNFFDYAISQAVQQGFINKSKEYIIPQIRETAETYWVGIGHFLREQFKHAYANQANLEPVVCGQITAYAGMVAAYHWNNDKECLTKNVLDGNTNYKITEERLAIYRFLDVTFVSEYACDVENILHTANNIDKLEEYFCSHFGYTYETEEETKLRAFFNKITAHLCIKTQEETTKRKISDPITTTSAIMNLMFRIGMAIGIQKFMRKYHIIGWINGEDKKPPRFLVAANPIPYNVISKSVKDVDFKVDCKKTTCFLLPYSLEWFNVIDKHQCDKEEGIVVEWLPDISDYEPSPVVMSGDKYKGYMHKELIEQKRISSETNNIKE